MRKIIIKLPESAVKKFRLQRNGWVGRRFLRASSLLTSLESAFPRRKLKENTSVVVKMRNGTRYENINETVASNNPKYLLWITACFLEEHLSKKVFKKYDKLSAKGGEIIL